MILAATMPPSYDAALDVWWDGRKVGLDVTMATLAE